MADSPKHVRRIGLIGDIHAENGLLECALAHFQTRRLDCICATGDIADGQGSIDRCCLLIESHQVITVRGNHDRWLIEGKLRDLPGATPVDAIGDRSRRFLETLPPTVELETPLGRLLLCHGLGPHDMAKVNADDNGYALESNDALNDLLDGGRFRWILNGHTHRRMVRYFNGVTIVNAGTLKRDQYPCCFELNLDSGMARLFVFLANGRIDPTPVEIPLIGTPSVPPYY